MSETIYRQLDPKDSARIFCAGVFDESCRANATFCETLHWDNGNTKGISFFYFCDNHGSMAKCDHCGAEIMARRLSGINTCAPCTAKWAKGR